MTKDTSKPIRFVRDKYLEVKQFTEDISAELGVDLSMPEAIMFAIRSTRESRGTPSSKAPAKGVSS